MPFSRAFLRGLFVVFACVAGGHSRTMYFDAESGSDAASGDTPSSARRSFAILRNAALKPGDSLLFKRGSRWTDDSLILSGAGTKEAPFVLGAYGDPSLARPRIENKGNLLVLRNASHLVVEDLELAGAHGGCVELRDSTVFHAMIRRIDAHDCGGGINASGGDIVIEGNTIHDGHMVVNTSEIMDDDYGATGIGFSRIDGCVVRGNRLWNLSAPSFDYGEDGGAFEFWKSARHCDISGNFAWKVNGFAEFGGQAGDSVIGVSVHHNVALENGPIACFHIRDSASLFGVGYDSVRFDNNLSVTRGGTAAGYHVIADGGVLDRADRIKIRNNIFVTDSSNYYSYQGTHSTDPTWVHEANLLWNPINDPFSNKQRVRGPGETYANPWFQDVAWSTGKPVDTVLASYRLSRLSPAWGAGLNLGYATDFFGSPASPGGVVDFGPFAHGTFTGVARRHATVRPSIRAVRGRLVISASSSERTEFDVAIADASGRIVSSMGSIRLDAGAAQEIALPHGARLPYFARLSVRTESGIHRKESIVLPPW